MYESSPFLLRRVFAGVLVGVVIAVVGCIGWAEYRISQYNGRENRLVAGYQDAYNTCLRSQQGSTECASRIGAACSNDEFWSQGAPYTFGLGSGLDAASVRCVFGRSTS